MGLFGRKERPERDPFKCFICDQEVEKRDYRGHIEAVHVTGITETAPSWLSPRRRAEGSRHEGFTWKCSCGVADAYWQSTFRASMGLMHHLAREHRFNGWFDFEDTLAFRMAYDVPHIDVIRPYDGEE